MSEDPTSLDRVPDEESRELLRAAGLRHLDWYAGPSDDDDDSVRTIRHIAAGNGNGYHPNGDGSGGVAPDARRVTD